MSIQWLESEQRFDWLPRIPLDGTCRTLARYIKEIKEAIDYRRDEVGESEINWNLFPRAGKKFFLEYYTFIKTQIQLLVTLFGYESVEDSVLLGRPWSELISRGSMYEWDKELLNDFREVLDKLILLTYGQIYISDPSEAPPPTRTPEILTLNLDIIDIDLKLINSFPLVKWETIEAVDGSDDPEEVEYIWSKTFSC